MKLYNYHILCLQSISRLLKVFLYFLTITILHNTTASGQNNFNPGEELKYIVYFGPVNAGAAKINLSRTLHNNEQVFYSKLVARSIGLPDKIYKVKDTYECYFDSITILPKMAIRDIREGKYRKKNIDTYDHQKNTVLTVNKGEIKTPAGIRDVISTFYLIRNCDFDSLTKGDILTFDLFFNDDLITFRVHYIGKEEIHSKIGKMNCIKLIPEMVDTEKNVNSENISPTPKDEMIIWLSDDPNRVPIRVRFDLFIGSINADLIEYINLKY
jgi:hypothetical protein